ncbi:IS3 family transposase [Olsenella uli]|uniref:IS3 family transposase n=1 Tax=Olsenella uli TaxID=133926 RepID=UPI0012ABDD79|nr:IS3 family transposase [Olsenella uli]
MCGFSGRHDLSDLLAAAGLARSTYDWALAHPKAPTRPDLAPRVEETFSRGANGVGHRQIAMELRAVYGARVADKTVLKVMRKLGLRRDPDAYIARREAQGQAEGPDPGGVPGAGPSGGREGYLIYRFQVLGRSSCGLWAAFVLGGGRPVGVVGR